jgi:hypothetical protein
MHANVCYAKVFFYLKGISKFFAFIISIQNYESKQNYKIKKGRINTLDFHFIIKAWYKKYKSQYKLKPRLTGCI